MCVVSSETYPNHVCAMFSSRFTGTCTNIQFHLTLINYRQNKTIQQVYKSMYRNIIPIILNDMFLKYCHNMIHKQDWSWHTSSYANNVTSSVIILQHNEWTIIHDLRNQQLLLHEMVCCLISLWFCWCVSLFEQWSTSIFCMKYDA